MQPAGAHAPDGCDDGTVLPGLIDTHGHLCADGTNGTLDRIGEPSDDRLHEVIADSLRRHLAAGVTTMRDLRIAASLCSTGARGAPRRRLSASDRR